MATSEVSSSFVHPHGLEDRVEVGEPRVEALENRRQVLVQQLAVAFRPRRPDVGGLEQAGEERVEHRRKALRLEQGRGQLARRRAQAHDDRVGVDRELLEARQGGARLALEGREDAEDVGEVLIALGRRREHLGRVLDRPPQLARSAPRARRTPRRLRARTSSGRRPGSRAGARGGRSGRRTRGGWRSRPRSRRRARGALRPGPASSPGRRRGYGGRRSGRSRRAAPTPRPGPAAACLPPAGTQPPGCPA